MREKDFVEQNKEKWKRFEDIASKSSNSNPDELDDLYTKITNDLSYARTYYNRRSIRVYLNKMAQSIYSELYKYRKGRKNAFVLFWTEQLPQSLFIARREMNISLIFFVFAMLLGILSSIHENDFAQLILGDRYVEMTEENILQVEIKDGVGVITLNRPDKLNAFNDELTFQLQDALKSMERNL
jgi:hypothetical protein